MVDVFSPAYHQNPAYWAELLNFEEKKETESEIHKPVPREIIFILI